MIRIATALAICGSRLRWRERSDSTGLCGTFLVDRRRGRYLGQARDVEVVADVGFVVTKLPIGPGWATRLYNRRGTAAQCIKEGKYTFN